MKTIKQKVWRVSLKMMWLAIVFLIACKSNQDKKTDDNIDVTPKKDSIKEITKTDTIVGDTQKKDTVAQIKMTPKKKPLPKKDTMRIKPRPTDPGPVCKYGVIRYEKPF